MLEELTDGYRAHSTDLAKTVSQYSRTQEEVRQIRYVCVRMQVRVFWFLFLCFNVLQWIRHNRSVVSELKEEVRKRILREHEPTSGKSASSASFHAHTDHEWAIYHVFFFSFLYSGASPLPQSHSREVRVEEADSDSEDFSPTPSLAEVSSDDLSWLDDKDSGEKECSLNEKCTQAHFP